MTTQAWSTRVRHDDDVTFREWGLELNTKLAAAGLVKTADTGQIDWATVVRPAGSGDGGYEIWRMNDAMQATAPVFFRIDYGTNTSLSSPRIHITTGTAVNGAGVLSGIGGSKASIHGAATQNSDTSRQSYLCVAEGFFGLNWKIGSGLPEGCFLFCRTVDAAGVPTALGSMQVWGAGAVSSLGRTQAFRYAATAVAFAAKTAVTETALCFSPQTPITTAVGADIQAMLAWTITPAIAPLVGICGVLTTEIAQGGTFSFAPVGVTAHTYIGLSNLAGPPSVLPSNSFSGLRFAMLWE